MLSILTLAIGQTAFAAEPALASNETVEVANEIQPRGTLSGYGSHWYNSGEDANGSFTFKVTGAPWVNAHLTVSMDNFNSETAVRITVIKPDGGTAYTNFSSSAMTMANRDKFANISFAPGEIGTYTVTYQIVSLSTTNPASSGRINVWVF